MTHTYNAVALPRDEFKTISPFIGIQEDMDEKAFVLFDDMLLEQGQFYVFQTHYTDDETKERMVRSNAQSHKGELIDYKAYVTWKNTLHLRFESVLMGAGVKCRNSFLHPNDVILIRRAIQNEVKPRRLSDCSYSIKQGCVVNNNA